ncbi:MAG: hypothetical protein QOG03_2045 [Actinomycetota bacterium]|jgi:hypothetical protein|nr:hypothetical protein [Actinomycetota bacterium]
MLESGGGGGGSAVGVDPYGVAFLARRTDEAADHLIQTRAQVAATESSVGAADEGATATLSSVIAWALDQGGPLRERAAAVLRDDLGVSDPALVGSVLSGQFGSTWEACSAGRSLAERYAKAADTEDTWTEYDVIQALGRHADDPFFTATFFNNLGPQATAVMGVDLETFPWGLTNDGAASRADALLKPVSLALGAASRSGYLQSDFADRLTTQDPLWVYDHRLEAYNYNLYENNWLPNVRSLFRYGNFEKGFVLTAADRLVMHTHREGDFFPGTMPAGFDGYDMPDYRLDVLGALGRNADASADFMASGSGRELVAKHWDFDDHGDAAGQVVETGLLELHRRSGLPADHAPTQVLDVLSAIAHQKGVDWSDDAKVHLAAVASNEIATFAKVAYDGQSVGPLDFASARLLLAEAMRSERGVATVMASTEPFAAAQLLSGLRQGDATAEARQVGSLYGLIQLADRDVKVADDAARRARQALIFSAIEKGSDLLIAGVSVAGIETGGPIGGWFLRQGKTALLGLIKPDDAAHYQALVDAHQIDTTVAVRDLIGASLWQQGATDPAVQRQLTDSADAFLRVHRDLDDFRGGDGSLVPLATMTDNQRRAFYQWVQDGSMNDHIGSVADIVEGSIDHWAKQN